VNVNALTRRDLIAIRDDVRLVQSAEYQAAHRNIHLRKCYDEIGCFTTDGCMKHIGKLPDSPDYINTKFLVYTQDSISNERYVSYSDISSLSIIPARSRVAFVVHGFGNDGKHEGLSKVKDRLLWDDEYDSVISVDWAKGATSPWYTDASLNTQVVGRQVAVLIDKLRTHRSIDVNTVHLIGYSLGAQIVGFAGKWSQEAYNYNLGRVTALDAAAPLFESYDCHVEATDANFVDSIHTSSGTNILTGELGFTKPVGDIDFYPNGGKSQPGCGIFSGITCNHGRSVLFFEASISEHKRCLAKFRSTRCASWNDYNNGRCNTNRAVSQMGFHSDTFTGSGTHYLKTGSNFPFCL